MTFTSRHYLIFITGCLFFNSIFAADKDDQWSFPTGFLIGTATAAYQIEGAWNVSDKGESNWDRFTHTQPNKILHGDNGDCACDSYHKFKDDVRLLKELGVDYYRFSLSWTRILPTGYSNVVSKDGIKYYNDLLDELERNNIIPFVTIYHWDHPQVFQEIGGWTNEVMVDLFGDYARVVFREFGNRVKTFITINEPNVVCEEEYYTGAHPPGFKLGKHTEYLCTHNIIKAHARAYHIYNDEFRNVQKGKIGFVVDCYMYYPKNNSESLSSEVAFEYNIGRYFNPIFSKTGDYPEIIKKRIAENSKFEGLKRSRLPEFSEEWIEYIKGSADFLGLNHYSSKLVELAPRPKDTIYLNDVGIVYSYDPKWPSTPQKTLKIVPQGFRDILIKIKEKYQNPAVYITENGLPDTGIMNDQQRIEYLNLYMKAMLTAIKKYKCNIKSYTVWSLMDNLEWEMGYTLKYGLFHVDFNDPNRTRTPKASVEWFKKTLKTRHIQPA